MGETPKRLRWKAYLLESGESARRADVGPLVYEIRWVVDRALILSGGQCLGIVSSFESAAAYCEFHLKQILDAAKEEA